MGIYPPEPLRLMQLILPKTLTWIALTLLVWVCTSNDIFAGDALSPSKGALLVATTNLDQSSFRQTVILLTHYSERGATGIAINRSAKISLKEAFPNHKEFNDVTENLFLGGPVRTDAVFVLMQTQRPHAGMRKIANNIYFTVGIDAISHGLDNMDTDEYARAYMGYTGWAPGQLSAEIARGDWLVVKSDPSIIFQNDHEKMWQKLYQSWSGHWI